MPSMSPFIQVGMEGHLYITALSTSTIGWTVEELLVPMKKSATSSAPATFWTARASPLHNRQTAGGELAFSRLNPQRAKIAVGVMKAISAWAVTRIGLRK